MRKLVRKKVEKTIMQGAIVHARQRAEPGILRENNKGRNKSPVK
jgi:hypothetical protein